jgi:uncharacterized protein (TIRG00374 family)
MAIPLLSLLKKLFPLIGIALLLYMFLEIGLDKIVSTFLALPWYYYLLALLVFLPRMFLYSYKWQYISKKQQMDLPLIFLMKIFLISLFYGGVTPGAIGLHLRIYYLKEKAQATLEKCVANSFIDSTLSFLSGLFLALVGSVLLASTLPELTLTIAAVFLLVLGLFIIFMTQRVAKRLFRVAIRLLVPRNFKELAGESLESLYEDIPRLRYMVVPFVLECIILLIAATQVYMLSLAFSLPISYGTFILLSVTSVVIGNALPITVGGLGVREGAFVVFLSQYGVPAETAFVLSLGGYLVKILLPGFVGWSLSLRKHH